MTERTHWLSDCIVGAFIGIYGTKLEEQMMTSPGVVLYPGLDPDWYGVCLQVEF